MPVTSRRSQPERSATTRSALVTAARPLFAAHGFAAVGTEAIAAAAGVSRGALYHQFADKTELFAAVVDAVEADVARRLAESVGAAANGEPGDPVAAMRIAARAWLQACAEPEVHRIALVDGPSVLGWARWRTLCQGHVFGLVQQLLANAIHAGLVRSHAVVPLAHVFMGASDEAALYVAGAPDPDAARAEMIDALELLIDGLVAR
ncbi:MAG TPA: TetR/AcrR family transcriptional regulator [Jatrophihabitantaceae bacterium]|nr:TetR/AcrR family transcriptional regulator [Jatrophihabitantaceae bacterium]